MKNYKSNYIKELRQKFNKDNLFMTIIIKEVTI